MVQNHFCGACDTPRVAGVNPYILPIERFVGTVWRRLVHLAEKSSMAILWNRFWCSLFDPFFLCAFVSKHLWSYQKQFTFLGHICVKQHGRNERWKYPGGPTRQAWIFALKMNIIIAVILDKKIEIFEKFVMQLKDKWWFLALKFRFDLIADFDLLLL